MALAQDDSGGLIEDNYDPFADYSEFVEATSEESDINFFKHGRLLTLAAGGGLHTMTGTMADYYSKDPVFGLFFSYFFAHRFAVQFGYSIVTHHLDIPDAGDMISARIRLNTFSFHAKHFFNTQNMTRAFGDLNPFILGGFSQILRDTSTNYSVFTGSDGALGFDVGIGFEYMFNRRKNFLGFTLLYQYADFPNEDYEVPSAVNEGESTGIKLRGDILSALITIGINF